MARKKLEKWSSGFFFALVRSKMAATAGIGQEYWVKLPLFPRRCWAQTILQGKWISLEFTQ